MKDNREKIKIIKEITEKIFSLGGFEALIDVAEDTENRLFKVEISPSEKENAGILIGYHGENLSSLQLILGVIVSKKIGEWTRVAVNIGDYRQKREEVLRRMALSAAWKVKFSGEPVFLPPLSSLERRMIHLALADHVDVVSESEGEGESRRVVVKPRKSG